MIVFLIQLYFLRRSLCLGRVSVRNRIHTKNDFAPTFHIFQRARRGECETHYIVAQFKVRLFSWIRCLGCPLMGARWKHQTGPLNGRQRVVRVRCAPLTWPGASVICRPPDGLWMCLVCQSTSTDQLGARWIHRQKYMSTIKNQLPLMLYLRTVKLTSFPNMVSVTPDPGQVTSPASVVRSHRTLCMAAL